MREYLELVERVLTEGTLKENRTGVNTLSVFNHNYVVDIEHSFPLLTTKDMSGRVWNSLIHELVWYLSGAHHIRDFEKHSKIWSSWGDEDRNLETAYGRFWRRFPVPNVLDRLDGEAWGTQETMMKYVREEPTKEGRYVLEFDQIAYILDQLQTNPFSRRMVLTAWHPANAAVSRLPPCHYTACFNVTTEKGAIPLRRIDNVTPDMRLNCHLTQRSGDVGLGIPFNIACYSALTYILAKASGLVPGKFAHTIVDAHIYCGGGDDDPYSHVLALREQLTREPRPQPVLNLLSEPEKGKELEWINGLRFEDFQLEGYNPHPHIPMKVAV